MGFWEEFQQPNTSTKPAKPTGGFWAEFAKDTSPQDDQRLSGYHVTTGPKFHGGQAGEYDIAGMKSLPELQKAAQDLSSKGFHTYIHWGVKGGKDQFGHTASAPSLHIADSAVVGKSGKYGTSWMEAEARRHPGFAYLAPESRRQTISARKEPTLWEQVKMVGAEALHNLPGEIKSFAYPGVGGQIGMQIADFLKAPPGEQPGGKVDLLMKGLYQATARPFIEPVQSFKEAPISTLVMAGLGVKGLRGLGKPRISPNEMPLTEAAPVVKPAVKADTAYTDRFAEQKAFPAPKPAPKPRAAKAPKVEAAKGEGEAWTMTGNDYAISQPGVIHPGMNEAWYKQQKPKTVTARHALLDKVEAGNRAYGDALMRHRDLVDQAADQGKIGVGIQEYPEIRQKYGVEFGATPAERAEAKRIFEEKWQESYGNRPPTETLPKREVPIEVTPTLSKAEAQRVAKMTDAELADYNATPTTAPVEAPRVATIRGKKVELTGGPYAAEWTNVSGDRPFVVVDAAGEHVRMPREGRMHRAHTFSTIEQAQTFAEEMTAREPKAAPSGAGPSGSLLDIQRGIVTREVSKYISQNYVGDKLRDLAATRKLDPDHTEILVRTVAREARGTSKFNDKTIHETESMVREELGRFLKPTPPSAVTPADIAQARGNKNLQVTIDSALVAEGKPPINWAKQVKKSPADTEAADLQAATDAYTSKGGAPSTAESPVVQEPIPGLGESGKVKLTGLLKAGAVAAGGVLGYTALQKAKNEQTPWNKPIPAKEGFLKGGTLSKIADLTQVGNYLAASVAREVALPGKQGIGVKERRTFSDVLGVKGLLPDIVLDPLTYIAPGTIVSKLGKGARTVGLGKVAMPVVERAAKLAKSAENIGMIRKAIDAWEYTLGFTVRGETKLARELGWQDYKRYLIEKAQLQTEAEEITKTIKKAGGQVDKDVSRVVDAGLEAGRPPRNYQAILTARTALHEELKAAKGMAYANKIKKVAESAQSMKHMPMVKRAVGADVAADVERFLQAGLSEGHIPIDRSHIGWAKQTVLRAIAAENGMEHRNLVSKLAMQVEDFEDKIGRMLTSSELLERQTADAWRRIHLRRIYGSFEDAEAYIADLAKADPKKAQKLMSELQAVRSLVKSKPDGAMRFSALLQRQTLSPELRDILKEIPEASARLASGAEKTAEIVARSNMYHRLAETLALSDEQVAKMSPDKIKGYMLVPDVMDPATHKAAWGALTGKWLPEAMFYDLMHDKPSTKLHFVQKLVAYWKMGKVPLSLPTQARNFITNIMLADVLGKTAPYRIDRYAQALKALATKDETYQEASKFGVFLHDTFISQELQQTINDAIKSKATPFGLVKRAIGTTLGKASNVYQFNEQWFKMAVYINSRGNGMPAEMAAEFADRALFNYRRVPRAVDFMRKWGIFPFMVFPYKAIPAIGSALWNDTGRLARYTKGIRSVESMTPIEQRRKEEAVMPDWMKGGGMLRLPGKASKYLNLAYLLPYQEAENIGQPTLASALGRFPPSVLGEVAANRSLYTGREIVPNLEQARILDPQAVKLAQREHIAKAALPGMTPPIPGVLPRGGSAFEGMFAGKTKAGEKRSVGERVGYSLGFKTYPVDVKKESVWRIRELEDLQRAVRTTIRRATKNKPQSEWTPAERKAVEKITDNFRAEAMRMMENVRKANK